MLERIFDSIKNNLKNPSLYIFLIVIVIIILFLFPYIDANVFYYNRVNNRIEILDKISKLDTDLILQNDILNDEYENILIEIGKQKDNSLSSVFIKETNDKVNVIKFITGGSIFFIISIACLFLKTLETKLKKFIGLMVFIVIGIIFGNISIAIPTILSPIVNYVGFPSMIIIIIGLLATKQKAK